MIEKQVLIFDLDDIQRETSSNLIFFFLPSPQVFLDENNLKH